MLSKSIKARSPEVPVWIGPDQKPLHPPEIDTAVATLRSRHAALHGKRIVLRCESDLTTARALLALDGFCAELLLVHPGTSEEEYAVVERNFHADAVLTDADLTGTGTSGPPGSYAEVPTRWMIPTSGTTKAPRLIPHDVASLSRTVRQPAAAVYPRWGLLYGITRFAGLQVFLQSLLGGGILLFPPPSAPLPEKIEYLVNCRCTSLSATPTYWRKILMAPHADRLSLRQITLGGEIVDQPLLDLVKARFDGSRIVHIYASTETGVGFTVKDGRSGFPFSWVREGVDNVGIKIAGDTLWLKVPGRTVVPDSDAVEIDDAGYINTGDLVSVTGDRVMFLGRMNGTINVGGNKVSPEEVEQVLLAHPAVLLASVYGARNPISGQIVVADVALKPGCQKSTELEKELRSFCRNRLPLYKVPARVSLVEDITVNASGKVTRRRVWTG